MKTEVYLKIFNIFDIFKFDIVWHFRKYTLFLNVFLHHKL